MADDELTTIGQFAHLSGLSVQIGGTELVAPRDAQGMPHNSAVKDPSGNWNWLYQG
ncbi:hypothetical protein KDL01_13220 [Actinospica durhamensis]|uniref:Uncharacterized protein n=1 Tax=Actinospica durhamensis TaxID=1508375 RepID=A0A941EUN6_9ACTN|nr:hypothetical protein [Actinospica durhamensis]MBR7834229.1 hypothetical protein [Actinospica durhamensis]